MNEDRPLTGFRVPRFVNLNSPEALERIQRLFRHLKRRYPLSSSEAQYQARQQAVFMDRLRVEGFSAADRADLKAWLDQLESPPAADPAEPPSK